MIDETIQLPCGAKLTVQQGDDPDTYVLLRLVGDRPLDKFARVEPDKNAITVSIDPANLPVLFELVTRMQPKKKFNWKKIFFPGA